MDALERTITSLEVAEMVDRRHDHVLRDIEKISEHLDAPKSVVVNYFIESNYTDSKGEDRPCYLLTKKGCELYSTRMTGAKGTQFAVAYIERFNEMETIVKEASIKIPQSPQEALRLMFDYQEEVSERVEAVESDVSYLKDNQLITQPDYDTIGSMVGNKVRIICSQQHLNKSAKKELFRDLNGGIKRITGAAARNRIKAKQFDEVIEFINNWMPSTATMTVIKQMELMEDE